MSLKLELNRTMECREERGRAKDCGVVTAIAYYYYYYYYYLLCALIVFDCFHVILETPSCLLLLVKTLVF
jgi:hypothetical protein